jgi:hypothetical protein
MDTQVYLLLYLPYKTKYSTIVYNTVYAFILLCVCFAILYLKWKIYIDLYICSHNKMVTFLEANNIRNVTTSASTSASTVLDQMMVLELAEALNLALTL